MSYQQVRPSQFVTTYGPGAVLETRTGPVIIRSMDRLFTDRGLIVADFEIRDIRLTRDPRLDDARIVRLPSNAELSVEEKQPIYPTEPFPFWCLCTDHRILYQSRVTCPTCPTSTPQQNREKAGREAIRFIQACVEGHLDEVDWNYLVHRGQNCQQNRGYFRWTGGGGALRNILIECPSCNAQPCNFGVAYTDTYRCTERYAERGNRPPQPTCGARAQIMQRGAANLRMPVTVSALTIPPLTTRLHNILQDIRIMNSCGTLRGLGLLNEVNFRAALKNLNPALKPSELQFIDSCDWNEIDAALTQIDVNAQPAQRSLKDEEFESLRFAASHGASVPSAQLNAPSHYFELRPSDVQIFLGPAGNQRLRVAPIVINHDKLPDLNREYLPNRMN